MNYYTHKHFIIKLNFNIPFQKYLSAILNNIISRQPGKKAVMNVSSVYYAYDKSKSGSNYLSKDEPHPESAFMDF